MSEVFFISDTHFGHSKILEFESANRPFKTIEEHDQELIKRWNATVSPKDTVWHLGDFCLGKKSLEVAGELNGYKRLVLGNHDVYRDTEYLKYFNRLYGCAVYKGYILTHIPVHPDCVTRWTANIHGHLHSKTLEAKNYINVSCENTFLAPVNFEVLNKRHEAFQEPSPEAKEFKNH